MRNTLLKGKEEKSFGYLFYCLREKAGYTATECAYKLGTSSEHITEVEDGVTHPSEAFLKKAAKLFDIPIDLLVFMSLRKESAPAKKQEQWEKVVPPFRAAVFEMLELE